MSEIKNPNWRETENSISRNDANNFSSIKRKSQQILSKILSAGQTEQKFRNPINYGPFSKLC